MGRDHYESYFLRLHPPGTDRRALWLRYTLLARQAAPDMVRTELWGTYFDSTLPQPVALRHRTAINSTTLSADPHQWIAIDGHALTPRHATGAIAGPPAITWDLSLDPSPHPPVVPYPYQWMYRAPFPKAKVVTPYPHCIAHGTLCLGTQCIPIDGWEGSLGHNWGRAHAEQYRWIQCSHFIEHPDAFFEAAVAQLRIGPCSLPPLAFFWLRIGKQIFPFNQLHRLINHPRPSAPLAWVFVAHNGTHTVVGSAQATAVDCVALPYESPNGTTPACINASLAALTLQLYAGCDTTAAPLYTLTTPHHAALEILGRNTYGVPLRTL
ncbi:MAG: hypothetical protein HY696_04265 [Deltaproteobacteria bacterium]|nr:hypothetical protein [Deltaproteobacteria bacterium]